MTSETRRFHGRLYGLIYVAPGIATSLTLYALLFLRQTTVDPSFNWTFTTIPGFWSHALIVLWLVAVAGLSSLLERAGYLLFNLKHYLVKPDAEQAGLLREALLPLATSKPEWTKTKLEPLLVQIGEVPLLAVQQHKPPQLWISTFSLRATPVDSLQQLILHERAHLALKAGLQEWILRSVLWALSWPAVQLLWPNPLWIAAAAAGHVSAWSWVNYAIRMRRERQADSMAGSAVGTQQYARHLEDYLAQFDPEGSTGKLSQSRLGPLLKGDRDNPIER